VEVVYFFEVPRIARSGSTAYSEPGFTFLPASDRNEVENALDTRIVNAIMVPARSVDCWFAIEGQIPQRITMPRILVVISPERSKLWNSEMAEEAGFDGLVVHDPKSPNSGFTSRFTSAVYACTTAGARQPTRLPDIARCPSLDDITQGDSLNLRILQLNSLGRTHEEIALALDRAPQTVRNRISAMIHRAGVRNHTELAITYEQILARQQIPVRTTPK
jgi:DNA-binding CsgD family transcriptional regulator